MSNAKKAVLSIVATLALALIMGATSNGIEMGSGNEQASDSPMELMQLAGHEEDENNGG